MSLGMIILTALGLFVGLGVMYLAWRFVDSQPSELDPSTLQPREKVEDTDDDEQKRRRARNLALFAMALGLSGLLFVLLFGPSSPLR